MSVRIVIDSTADLPFGEEAKFTFVPLTIHFGEQEYIDDSAFLWEGKVEKLPLTVVGSVVGTHAGPGAVAVAFFAK